MGAGTLPTFPSHARNKAEVQLVEPIPRAKSPSQQMLELREQEWPAGGKQGRERRSEIMGEGTDRQDKGYWDLGSSLSYQSGCDRWTTGGLGSSIPSDQGRGSYEVSPMPFEIGISPTGTPPIDPILLEAAKVYSEDDSTILSPKPIRSRNDEPREKEEVCEIELEGHRRKRKRLTTDLEKAHLVRLCINNFGGYDMGRDKFFASVGLIYGKEKNTPAPDVKSWMIRRENERRKEVEKSNI